MSTPVSPASSAPPASPAAHATIWTCSMHPQIRRAGPGKCPICGMTLIAANVSPGQGGAIILTAAAQARAGVRTVPVERRRVTREIRAVGKVQQNETAVSTDVHAGQPLMKMDGAGSKTTAPGEKKAKNIY